MRSRRHDAPSKLWVVATVLLGFHALGESPAEFTAVRLTGWTHPPDSILELNLFKDSKRQVPNLGVLSYELTTPHFADHATLHRFLWVPPGKQVVYQEPTGLIYPEGTALILTVGYPRDLRDPSRGEPLMETRLLIRRDEEWSGLQYIWNPEGTDARLSAVGGERRVSWFDVDGVRRRHKVRMPNRNECNMCHEISGGIVPLGSLDAGYINRSHTYHDGETANQLVHWARLGILNGAPKDPDHAPRIATWNDPATGTVELRARAYLDMNCSACHRPGGLGYTSGLDLRYQQQTPIRYGVLKAPVAAGRGVGTARFSIVQGHPNQSMLVHRMKSTDPGIRMPPVGRSRVHEEGVALVETWIAQMQRRGQESAHLPSGLLPSPGRNPRRVDLE